MLKKQFQKLQPTNKQIGGTYFKANKMKLIKQVKLFFFEGKSDKVYEIDLCEINPTAYVVNFRYGRRGAALKEGTKTPEFVNHQKGLDIFAALENEKRKKGYQSEVEVFVALPTLSNTNEATPKSRILKRLEDAATGQNSFKTVWKTSRVIWKAAMLNITEAVPYILKIATKGDEMQLYASLYALMTLKAQNAIPLFESMAHGNRQKDYIRYLSFEALLQLSDPTEHQKTIDSLMELLPDTIKDHIDDGQYTMIEQYYTHTIANEMPAKELPILYLLSTDYQSFVPIFKKILSTIPFKPPYFKSIRAIFKLAKFKKDYHILSLLFYCFEKQQPMYFRTASLDPNAYQTQQYIDALDSSINLHKEYKNANCQIGFSQFTKYFFQKDSVYFLKNLGMQNVAADYLKFAVNVLLHFEESDYTPSKSKLLSDYGTYNYDKGRYYYTMVDYPECSHSYLLTYILFGNDTNRIMDKKCQFYTKKTVYSSKDYYFNIQKATVVAPNGTTEQEVTDASQKKASVFESVFSTIKTIFDKTKTSEPSLIVSKPTDEAPTKPQSVAMFPHLWEAFPEAYLQLLAQANMNLIVDFAYQNIKNNVQYHEFISKIDTSLMLILLDRPFEKAQEMGFEVLEHNQQNIGTDAVLVGKILDVKSEKAQLLAQKMILNQQSFFTNHIDFWLTVIFNTKSNLNQFINELIHNSRLTEVQKEAILGKAVVALMGFENNDDHNQRAIIVTDRLKMMAYEKMSGISWEIISQLLVSELENNTLLASEILMAKSKITQANDLPIGIIQLLLQNDEIRIRANGLELLRQYESSTMTQNWTAFLHLFESAHQEVVESLFELQNIDRNNQDIQLRWVEKTIWLLVSKEHFEGAYSIFRTFIKSADVLIINNLHTKWIVKLLLAYHKENALLGFELLQKRLDFDAFSMKQIVALASHEFLDVRKWVWQYYKQHTHRIKQEKKVALTILDASWQDSRQFAFDYFRSHFTATDWDAACLIGIVDAVRPDVELFGKELISLFFDQKDAPTYLYQLSQHPSRNIQLFVTQLLETYLDDSPKSWQAMAYYFKSVLTKVNQSRAAKNRIYQLLYQKATLSEDVATIVATILDEVSATSSIQDKATCIDLLSDLKKRYPKLAIHLQII
ncbi:hypothetical protein B0A77_04250 [Flavobacterium branchiophilum]|uniref:WGR domain-containing protein n=2 Tax=Flavobacterium branchiophilum TaxID=55197 RepID=A0A2H3KDB8_9FLAO|nr:hypothetical protein B0A77_04250 [Flavobacterium branchiophilum]